MRPVCGAAEAAVGEQGDGVGEGGDAFDGGGDGEHLTHAGAAFGAFVADDEDVAGVDFSGFDGDVAVFFVLEDARGAGVEQPLVAGDLDDAAVRGEVAAENDETAGGLERLVPRVDDGLVGGLNGEGCLFVDGLAGAPSWTVVERLRVEQARREETRAAGLRISPWPRTCLRARGRR